MTSEDINVSISDDESINVTVSDDETINVALSAGVAQAKIKVSSNDTTPDYLESKVSAGTGISLSVTGEGADETLVITNTGEANTFVGGNGIDITEDPDDTFTFVVNEGNLSLNNLGEKSHTSLTDIGSNTHAQIDTYISTTAPDTFLKLDQTTTQTIINSGQTGESVKLMDGTYALNVTGNSYFNGSSLDNIFQISNLYLLSNIHTKIDILNNNIKDYFGNLSINWVNRVLYASDGTTTNLNWLNPSYLQLENVTLAKDKIIFTQTDGNEYIDSLNDGYMDYGATTAHRFNNDLIVNTDTFFVDTSTGYVGIGTATPAEPLEIYFTNTNGGDAGLKITNEGTSATSSYAGIRLQAQNGTVNAQWMNVPESGTIYPGGGLIFRTISNHDIAFITNNNISNPRMVIDKSGDISIAGETLFSDKIKFTQTDGNEYIDSLNDGYLDLGATEAIRLNSETIITPSAGITLTVETHNFGPGFDIPLISLSDNLLGFFGGINEMLYIIDNGSTTDGALLRFSNSAGGDYTNIIQNRVSKNFEIYNSVGDVLIKNKVLFTQTDGNEYIDSLNDGYMDYGATTGHRFNKNIYLPDDEGFYFGDSAVGNIKYDSATSRFVITASDSYGVFINNKLTTKAGLFTNEGNVLGSSYAPLEVHLEDDNFAWTAAFYNDIYSTVLPTFTYYGYNNGDFAQGTENYTDLIWYTNSYSNERMKLDKDGDLFVYNNLEVGKETYFKDKIYFTQTDKNEFIDSLADGYMDYGATTQHRFNNSIVPSTDDSYYLGEIGTPFKAWKAIVLKDTTDGKHYKIEVVSGSVTATALD